MLYELRPDLFPSGYLSEVETALWGMYFEEREAMTSHG